MSGSGDCKISFIDGGCELKLLGKINKESIRAIYPKIKKLKSEKPKYLKIECSSLKELDYDGGLVLAGLIVSLSREGVSTTVVSLDERYKDILLFARKNYGIPKKSKRRDLNIIDAIGKNIYSSFDSFLLFLYFVGEIVKSCYIVLLNPWRFRFKATAVLMERAGAKALPIVALTSFLVGLVIAFQGAIQLSKFGANIFIVDMVNISVFRELAPLIAAIVIAGRSSSSFTAEIGTMKITEEIDAMKTMGFDPVIFLVLPRMVALMLSMPLIVFFADIVGVFGGMVVADLKLGISFSVFIQRTQEVLALKHVLIGLLKAPVFGLLIALIGCFRGFEVTGSTESIGRYTTISVVNAIFWVIAFNAIISVMLTELGI